MACTTILVGKKASYDGSTIIARNEDAMFVPKKMVVITPDKQPKKYKSKISKISACISRSLFAPQDACTALLYPTISTSRIN